MSAKVGGASGVRNSAGRWHSGPGSAMIRETASDARMIAFVNHWELIVILVVVLLLFGHRLPGMARSLGSGITEFRRGLKDGSSKPNDGKEPPANPPAGGAGSGNGGSPR